MKMDIFPFGGKKKKKQKQLASSSSVTSTSPTNHTAATISPKGHKQHFVHENDSDNDALMVDVTKPLSTSKVDFTSGSSSG
eukprot:CAMPEP_0119553398 /NCGR_PEP_ID=MMETSP1352-20130426/6165_1 /TAXON_ID=265584 /ORGANISM="Stauroneis constricta, Strain CCMP1120" /LENGTH=80 /DNA_ID=CAMNT_0007599799 /DNA_START=57 /DNA_END=295 /DNA_ORIENTATION=+